MRASALIWKHCEASYLAQSSVCLAPASKLLLSGMFTSLAVYLFCCESAQVIVVL